MRLCFRARRDAFCALLLPCHSPAIASARAFAWLEFNDLLGGDFQGSARGWVFDPSRAARSVTSNAPKPISCTDSFLTRVFLDGFNETIEQRSGGPLWFGLSWRPRHQSVRFLFMSIPLGLGCFNAGVESENDYCASRDRPQPAWTSGLAFLHSGARVDRTASAGKHTLNRSNMNGCCAFVTGRSGLECQWETTGPARAIRRQENIGPLKTVSGLLTMS